MNLLIKLTRFGVLIHLLWAGITALIITLSLGETIVSSFELLGVKLNVNVGGTAGEASYDWFLYLITFMSRVIYLYGFYRLWCLFGVFAEKRYFSQDAIGHLRVFTGLFVLFTLLRIAIELIYIGFYAPADSTATFDTSYLSDLMLSALFYIIAHIFNEARKQEEEMENYF